MTVHLKKRFQWEQLILAKPGNVCGDWLAQHDLLITGDVERAVILGETFIKPEGHVGIDAIQKQVSVFVKDYVIGVLVATNFCGESDVIDVRIPLKKTRGVWFSFEWPVRLVTLENDHRSWCVRIQIGFAKQTSDGRSKLFEPYSNLPNLFLARISN